MSNILENDNMPIGEKLKNLMKNRRREYLCNNISTNLKNEYNSFVNNHDIGINNINTKMIFGRFDKDIVNSTFFSEKNIKEIKYRIRCKIYIDSKKRYNSPKLDMKDLINSMTEYYNMYGQNFDKNEKELIKKHIKCLNNMVINDIAKNAITMVEQYLKYLENITIPVHGNDHIIPQNTYDNKSYSFAKRNDFSK